MVGARTAAPQLRMHHEGSLIGGCFAEETGYVNAASSSQQIYNDARLGINTVDTVVIWSCAARCGRRGALHINYGFTSRSIVKWALLHSTIRDSASSNGGYVLTTDHVNRNHDVAIGASLSALCIEGVSRCTFDRRATATLSGGWITPSSSTAMRSPLGMYFVKLSCSTHTRPLHRDNCPQRRRTPTAPMPTATPLHRREPPTPT